MQPPVESRVRLFQVIVALVFASAPFGYLVALYALGGIGLYLLVRVWEAKRRAGNRC